MSSKINLQTSPISAPSSIKFRRQSHVQAKWSIFKNRSKTYCFCVFFRHPIMPTKANTRHATHCKNTKKTYKQINDFLSKLSLCSTIFGTDFQVRNLDVLGKVLGSILASIFDHVGVQNDVRMASNNHHEKRCQCEPNWSPNMTPRGLPKRPHESASPWRRSPSASWPLLCLTSRPKPNFGTMLDNYWIEFGQLLDQLGHLL